MALCSALMSENDEWTRCRFSLLANQTPPNASALLLTIKPSRISHKLRILHEYSFKEFKNYMYSHFNDILHGSRHCFAVVGCCCLHCACALAVLYERTLRNARLQTEEKCLIRHSRWKLTYLTNVSGKLYTIYVTMDHKTSHKGPYTSRCIHHLE